MGKTAIVYYSQHHGNTKKVLDAIANYGKDVFFIATAGNIKAELDIDAWDLEDE